MIAAWEAAARDLGIRITAPFRVSGTDFPVLVADFGSPKGALPVLLDDEERFHIANDAGYYASQLNPENYNTYTRQHFEDMLNDWQWFGEGPPPEWYTGEPWG